MSVMNTGDFVTAREHLDKLLKQQPKSDYVLYGLAALYCLTGHVEESLKTLGEAIQVSPALRFQARNDGDFQNLAEDPRFTELALSGSGRGRNGSPKRRDQRLLAAYEAVWFPTSAPSYPNGLRPAPICALSQSEAAPVCLPC